VLKSESILAKSLKSAIKSKTVYNCLIQLDRSGSRNGGRGSSASSQSLKHQDQYHQYSTRFTRASNHENNSDITT
jgi:hypothetical protein